MKAVIIFLLVAFSLQMVTSKKKKTLPKTCATSTVNGKQILRKGRITYCEDGWTVFQKRFDGSVDFQQNWKNYEQGFGNMSGEFWFGLRNIHRLTRKNQCRLRIDLWDFDDIHKFAKYSSFSVMSRRKKYKLRVKYYSGTAGDSLTPDHGYHNMPFTTYDRDNDMDPNGNCAVAFGEGQGGWWFKNCFYADLNAVWGRTRKHDENIHWFHWKGFNDALKATTMKLRCD